MSIYLLDADLGGTDSVQHLIDAGLVKHIPLHSFLDFEDAVMKLLPKVSEDDLIILDTVSQFANTVRGDMKLGTDIAASVWDKRSVYFSDKNYLTVYEATCQVTMRRLKNLRARGARIITTLHEDDQRDEISMTKKRAPAVNQAFYKALMASSSDVFPLSIVTEDELDDAGNVKLAAGTRVLHMRMSDDYVTKVHVPRHVSEKLPRGIKDPTLPKLYSVLQKRPSWLVIYGPPGAGKTSLACSEAEVPAATAAASVDTTPAKTKKEKVA